MQPPPPRLLAVGDHHQAPTSGSSPEHPFLSAHLLLPSRSPSPADLSSLHLPLSLAFSFLTHPSPSPRSLFVTLHAAGARFCAFYPSFASALLSLPFLLLPHSRTRILLALSELARPAAPVFAPLVVSLLRRVPFHADARLLELLAEHASFLADEEPQLLASAVFVFVFLRLLAKNHLAPFPCSIECKNTKNLEECREKLVSFCVAVLRDHFQVCALIGCRSSRHYGRTQCGIALLISPGWCTAVAISPEMETQLLFMMNNVKWGGSEEVPAVV